MYPVIAALQSCEVFHHVSVIPVRLYVCDWASTSNYSCLFPVFLLFVNMHLTWALSCTAFSGEEWDAVPQVFPSCFSFLQLVFKLEFLSSNKCSLKPFPLRQDCQQKYSCPTSSDEPCISAVALWLLKWKPSLQQPGWVPPHPTEGSLLLLLLTAGSSRHTASNTWIRLIQHKHLHQHNLFLLTCHTPLLQLCTCKWRKILLRLVRNISLQNSLWRSPKSPPLLAWMSLLL